MIIIMALSNDKMRLVIQVKMGTGLYLGKGCEDTIGFWIDKVITRLKSKTHVCKSLEERCALALLYEAHEFDDDITDIAPLWIFVHLGFHHGVRSSHYTNEKLWTTLVCLLKVAIEKPLPVFRSLVTDYGKFVNSQLDSVSLNGWMSRGMIRFEQQVYDHNQFVFAKEIGRRIIYRNGVVVESWRGGQYNAFFSLRHVEEALALSGDVEENPGPNIHSKPKKLEVKVVKKQFVQRLLEREKMKRKKNRQCMKEMRYAEGLLDYFVPSQFSTTNSMIQGVLSQIASLLTQFQESLEHKLKIPFVEISVSVVALMLAILERAWMSVSVQIVNLARLCAFPVADIFQMCFERDPKCVAESGDDINVQPISIFKFMYGFAFGLLGRDISLPTITRALQSFGRAALGVRSMKDLITFFYDKISALYIYVMYGVTWDQYQVMKVYPELENIYAACELIRQLTKEQIFSSVPVAEEILSVHKKILDLSIRTATFGDSNVKNRLKEFGTMIAHNVSLALASPARAHYVRKEPTAIYVYGRPGTGKTTLLEVLHARMYKRYWKTKCGFQSSKYTRESVNEFWDGYAAQPCVLMDDFANVVDVKGNPNPEYKELIGMVNNCQFPLHMAALGEKANTFFTSEFIMASSNQKVPIVTSMTDAGAILRRFHIYAEINVIPEAGEFIGDYYRYDPKKNTTGKYLRTDHYDITLYSPLEGEKSQTQIIKEHLSFEDFWEYLVNVVDERNNRASALQKEIAEHAGYELAEAADNEAAIMAKFDKIFETERFITTLEENVKDGSIRAWFRPSKPWREQFEGYASLFRDKLKKGLLTVKKVVSDSVSVLGDFIFALIPSPLLRLYLDVKGFKPAIITTLSAGLAYFLYKIISAPQLCEFYSDIRQKPCMECKACALVNFPFSGSICGHFVATLSPVLLDGLKSLGVEIVKLQTQLLQFFQRQAESLRKMETPVRATNKFAESRIYNNDQIRKSRVFAESAFVTANTPIYCGDTRFAEMDQVQVEQVTQVLLKNSVWLDVVDDNGMSNKANGVFLVGRTLLTTAHTVKRVDGCDPPSFIAIQNPYSELPTIKIPYSDCKISYCTSKDGKDLDLALVTFPNCVPSRRRILTKFVSSNQLDNVHDGTLVMSGFKRVGSKIVVEEKYLDDYQVHFRESQYILHREGCCPSGSLICTCAKPRIGSHLEYGFSAGPGACGSLISIQNKAVHSKLVGVHVAGGKSVTSLGAITTREFLERSLETHIKRYQIPLSYTIDGRLPYADSLVDPTGEVELVHDGDCLAVGTYERSEPTLTTKINPSLICGALQDPITKPALLRPKMIDNELVDPMKKGIIKVLGPQQYVDDDLLRVATEDVFAMFDDEDRSLLTYEQTITGVEGNPYIRAINRSTSPGFPYMFTNPGKGKEKWMGEGEDFIVDDPELRADYDELIRLAKQGIRGDAISVATLKDERRLLEKVSQGKTRVFEACPQHLALALRQYYGTFIACVMRGRISNEICVGINPYSLEWSRLALRLLEKGDHMIAGDFSNYDGSLTQQIVSLIGEYIDRWYGDGNSVLRAALWEHVSNADVLIGRQVIRQTHSQPSGNPLTVIVNSIFNCIIMRLAYLQMKRNEGLNDMCDFRDVCSLAVYGDDNILSVRSDVAGWFNPETLTKALAKFGMVYTDEQKHEMQGFRNLTEISFLKRGFDERQGLYWAPMEVPNILEIANWIRGKAYKLATSENVENCLRELALHPASVYDKYRDRIKRLVAHNRLTIRVPTYYEWQSKFRLDMERYEEIGYDPTDW